MNGVGAERDAGAGNLVEHDAAETEARLSAAAVLLRHLDAQDPQITELPEEFTRWTPLIFPLLLVRNDILRDEIADRRPEFRVRIAHRR